MAYRGCELYYWVKDMSSFRERFGKLTVQQAIELNIAVESKEIYD